MTIYAKWIQNDQRFEFSEEDNGGVQIADDYHREITYKNSLGYSIVSDDDGYPSVSGMVLSLQRLKDLKKEEINQKREEALQAGFQYKNNLFDCDNESRANVTAVYSAIKAGVTLPEDFVWRSHSNLNIAFTSKEFTKMAEQMLLFVNEIYKYSFELKDLIDMVTDADAINAINWLI